MKNFYKLNKKGIKNDKARIYKKIIKLMTENNK